MIARVAPLLASAERTRFSLIDAQVLPAACGSDGEILARIVAALRLHLPVELERAADCLRVSDASELREAAHRIYGMVSAISSQAGALASELEDRAELGELSPAGSLLARLTAMSQQLLAVLGDVSIDALEARLES